MKKRSIAIAVAISAIMVISSLSVAYSSGDFNHGNLSAATNLQPSYISNHSNNVVIHHNSMNKTDGSRNGYGQAVSYSLSSAVNLSANDLSQNGVLLYPVNFVQAGLPIGTEWNITLEGKTHSTYNITYSTYLPNGNYSYNISNSGVFYPVQPSGKFSIKSSGIHVNILFRSETGISSTLSFENNSIIQGIYSYHETGYGPYNAIYNPVNGFFYSANVYNGTVSIINASIGKIYKTLKVGMDPISLAVNPSSGTVYVANFMSSSISYISINNTVTMNLSVSDFPSHILFDPISGNLFVTNLSDTMTMIGPTNRISSVNFNSPVSQIVLDSHNGNIFVKTSATIYSGLKGGAKQIYYLSGNGSLLYGFNLTRNTSPNSIIYNSGNNRVYSIFSIISGHSLMESSVNGTVIKTWNLGYGPDEMYYNNGSGSFYIFSYSNENTTIHIYNGLVEPLNNITLVGEIQGIAFGASLDTAVLPDSYNNELYISSPIYNTRSVTLRESGIVGNNKWGISYEGHEYISTSTFLNFTISDNSFNLNFLNVSGYEKPINININSGFRNVVLEAKYLKLYNVVIAENGLPDMLWTIILHNETFSINGNSIALNMTNGTYPLTILKSGSYYPDPSNETLAVMGSGLNIMIEFSASTYGVYFKEQSLPSDTLWYLNLSNGENYKSTGSSIKFSAPNSTYYFTIATGNKSFTPFNHTGIFTVAGKGVYINVSFRMVTYSVNVSESGLPLGISWYFGLQGSGNLASFNGSSFSMNLPNGTYSYYVKSSNSEYFPAINEGSFTIHGSS
ncbi:MAG: YncE family protein, partial [Thermoplasmataceae archaeon]